MLIHRFVARQHQALNELLQIFKLQGFVFAAPEPHVLHLLALCLQQNHRVLTLATLTLASLLLRLELNPGPPVNALGGSNGEARGERRLVRQVMQCHASVNHPFVVLDCVADAAQPVLGPAVHLSGQQRRVALLLLQQHGARPQRRHRQHP